MLEAAASAAGVRVKHKALLYLTHSVPEFIPQVDGLADPLLRQREPVQSGLVHKAQGKGLACGTLT
jgi:hypothetical protein